MKVCCLLLALVVSNSYAQSGTERDKSSAEAEKSSASNESCSIPVKKYAAGQRLNHAGDVRGEMGFTLTKVEGNVAEGTLHIFRSARDCGGDHRVTGTCRGNQLTGTVHRQGVGTCESRVAFKLEYTSDGLVGKLGRDLINNASAPPNLIFGR